MAWAKGTSGNPKGRPAGHQDRFKAKFWADLHYAWDKAGADALERMIQSHPNQFIDICARVLPKDEQRREIQHSLEVTLRQPDWLKLDSTQPQVIDVIKNSDSD